MLQDVGLHRPTLDDVFLSLTGHAATVAEAAEDDDDNLTGGGRSDRQEAPA